MGMWAWPFEAEFAASECLPPAEWAWPFEAEFEIRLPQRSLHSPLPLALHHLRLPPRTRGPPSAPALPAAFLPQSSHPLFPSLRLLLLFPSLRPLGIGRSSAFQHSSFRPFLVGFLNQPAVPLEDPDQSSQRFLQWASHLFAASLVGAFWLEKRTSKQHTHTHTHTLTQRI